MTSATLAPCNTSTAMLPILLKANGSALATTVAHLPNQIS
jgi:hypothetical protein